jgi:hypothetical protein
MDDRGSILDRGGEGIIFFTTASKPSVEPNQAPI